MTYIQLKDIQDIYIANDAIQDIANDAIQDITNDAIQDITNDAIQDIANDAIQDITNDAIQLSVYKLNDTTGQTFYGFKGKYNYLPPVKQYDFYCRRTYLKSNTLKIKNRTGNLLLYLRKAIGRDYFTVFLKKKIYCHIYYVDYGGNTPKEFSILLPDSDTYRWDRKLSAKEATLLFKSNKFPGIHILTNIKPKFNYEKQCFHIKFKQSGGVPSVKNCQVEYNNKIVYELLRKKSDCLGIQYSTPISPPLAFILAITALC